MPRRTFDSFFVLGERVDFAYIFWNISLKKIGRLYLPIEINYKANTEFSSYHMISPMHGLYGICILERERSDEIKELLIKGVFVNGRRISTREDAHYRADEFEEDFIDMAFRSFYNEKHQVLMR